MLPMKFLVNHFVNCILYSHLYIDNSFPFKSLDRSNGSKLILSHKMLLERLIREEEEVYGHLALCGLMIEWAISRDFLRVIQ